MRDLIQRFTIGVFFGAALGALIMKVADLIIRTLGHFAGMHFGSDSTSHLVGVALGAIIGAFICVRNLSSKRAIRVGGVLCAVYALLPQILFIFWGFRWQKLILNLCLFTPIFIAQGALIGFMVSKVFQKYRDHFEVDAFVPPAKHTKHSDTHRYKI